MQKLVRGIGISNSGTFKPTIDGKMTKEYTTWNNMLRRCELNGLYQRSKPSYVGCEVHPDFIKFQDFAEWCQNQIGFEFDGYQMDKDILVPGNKVYGPDTCVFVPPVINMQLTSNLDNITWVESRNKYQVRLGRSNQLGRFDTKDEATKAYRNAKQVLLRSIANQYHTTIDKRVYDALMWWEI